MSKNSKKVTIVNASKPLDTPENDTDIQASKTPQTQPVNDIAPNLEVKKRVVPPRSEAQKAALAEGRKKGRETINAKNEQARLERESMQQRLESQQKELERLHKKEFEDKLIKKALATKKKQIKRTAVLDEVSDDETPIEEVRAMQNKAPKKQPQPAQTQQPVPQIPKYIFV